MANGEGRVCEGLQTDIDQPQVRPAPPRRYDRSVAKTVNSPSRPPPTATAAKQRFRADTLFQLGWVPGHVDVHQRAQGLQIKALARRVGGHQDSDLVLFAAIFFSVSRSHDTRSPRC